MSITDENTEPEQHYRMLARRFILFSAAVRQATSAGTLSERLDIKLTESQADALRFLALNNGVTIGEMATGLGHTMSGATKSVNRLEKQGWVSRDNRGEDQRTVYVNLTSKGMELANDLVSETETHLFCLFNKLKSETIRGLDHILEGFLRDFIDDDDIANKLCVACGFEGGIHCRDSDVDCVVAKTIQTLEPQEPQNTYQISSS